VARAPGGHGSQKEIVEVIGSDKVGLSDPIFLPIPQLSLS